MVNRPRGGTAPPLPTFTRVTFCYTPTMPTILNGVDFVLWPGERVSIVGDTGVGKSPMAKLTLRLYTPVTGIVQLFGHAVSWHHHYPQLGYIGDPAYPDGGLGLPPELTVGTVLKSVIALWDVSGYSMVRAELAERLELPSLRNRQIGQLSKGERQRLMACLPLVINLQLLIAMENEVLSHRQFCRTLMGVMASVGV